MSKPNESILNPEEILTSYFFCMCWQDAIDFGGDPALRRTVTLLDSGAVLIESRGMKRFYYRVFPSSSDRIERLVARYSYARKFAGDRRAIFAGKIRS